jgi:hypothetical protein
MSHLARRGATTHAAAPPGIVKEVSRRLALGCKGDWLSWLERHAYNVDVGGSNPSSPTEKTP